LRREPEEAAGPGRKARIGGRDPGDVGTVGDRNGGPVTGRGVLRSAEVRYPPLGRPTRPGAGETGQGIALKLRRLDEGWKHLSLKPC